MSEDDWKNGLFDCFQAPLACVWSTCVPWGVACMQATTARHTIAEEDPHVKACLFASCLCCFGVAYNRTRIRDNLKIKGSYWEDCIIAAFCPCCSMVREWREVMLSKGKPEDESVWRAYSVHDKV